MKQMKRSALLIGAISFMAISVAAQDKMQDKMMGGQKMDGQMMMDKSS